MFSKTHTVQKNHQQQEQNQQIRKSRPRNSKGKPKGLKCGGKNGTDGLILTNVVLPKQPYEEEQRKNQFFTEKFEELKIKNKKDQTKYLKDFEFCSKGLKILGQFSDAAKD